jgi:hypothetical protein
MLPPGDSGQHHSARTPSPRSGLVQPIAGPNDEERDDVVVPVGCRGRAPRHRSAFSFGKMANSDIIASMLRVVDDYAARRVSPEEVETSLESCVQALEGIGLPHIHRIRAFTHRLMSAHLSDGEMEFKDDERVETVLCELRDFLRSLPS